MKHNFTSTSSILEQKIRISFVCSFLFALNQPGMTVEYLRDLPIVEEFLDSVKWIHENVFAKVTNVEAKAKIMKLLPPNIESIVEVCHKCIPQKLQSKICTLYENNMFNAMVNHPAIAPPAKAHFLDRSDLYANTWLKLTGKDSSTYLKDEHVTLRLRYHLQYQPTENMPTKCCLCGFLYLNDPWHDLTCHHDRKGLHFGLVHNAVVNAVLKEATDAGFYASPKANILGIPGIENAEAVPDGLVITQNESACLDVVVSLCCAKSYLQEGSRLGLIRGGVNCAAEKRKVDHYKDKCANLKTQFYPVAVSYNGALGKAAVEFFSKLSAAEAMRSCPDEDQVHVVKDTFFSVMVKSLAGALVRGVADLIWEKMEKARAADLRVKFG
jgi:hypothetical protein